MKVVLITYSLSVLQSLTSGNTEENILRQLRQRKRARNSSPKSKLSYHEAKVLIRNKRLADFKHRKGGYNPQQYTLRLLSRHEQTMIFRLRTGHCRLRSHMIKIDIEDSAICGLEAQTTVPVLQSCPLHKEERETTPGQQKVP